MRRLKAQSKSIKRIFMSSKLKSRNSRIVLVKEIPLRWGYQYAIAKDETVSRMPMNP